MLLSTIYGPYRLARFALWIQSTNSIMACNIERKLVESKFKQYSKKRLNAIKAL